MMTAQMTEQLHYEGQDLQMSSTPLDAYLELADGGSPFGRINGALSRGYIGDWVIEDGRLHLRALLTPISRTAEDGSAFWAVEPHKVGLEDIFPKHDGLVFAHWFTGALHCPQGTTRIFYFRMPTIYTERYLSIDVVSGEVVGSSVNANRYSKHIEYTAYADVECACCGFNKRLFYPKSAQDRSGCRFHPVWCTDCGKLSLSDHRKPTLECGECGSKQVTVADDNRLRRASDPGSAWARLKEFTAGIFRRDEPKYAMIEILPDKGGVYSNEDIYLCPSCGNRRLKFSTPYTRVPYTRVPQPPLEEP